MACKKCSAACACRLKVTDTNTIDLTLAGSGSAAAPWVISGVALIDNRAGGPHAQGSPQALASDAANYLQEVAGDDGGLTVYPSLDDNNLVGVGTDGGIYLPFVDSPCIDIQGTGTEADPYTIVPIIAPADCGGGAHNFLSCNEPVDPADPTTGGLCVPLSGDAGNQTVVGVDGGIYTPPAQADINTACGLLGNGTPAAPLGVELDPDATNILVCGEGPGGAGLYVPATPITIDCGLELNAAGDLVVNTSGDDFGGIGDGACEFADGSIIVCDPATGEVRGEPPYQQSQGNDAAALFPGGFTLAPGEEICGPIVEHVVTNPSNCRTLSIHLQSGYGYAGAGQDANIQVNEMRDIGNPPPGVLTLSPAFHQSGAFPNNSTVNYSAERDFTNITIPPGATHTFRSQICLRNIGTGPFISNNPLSSSLRHWGGTA